MRIDFTKSGGSVTAAINGRLDTTTAPELERFLAENLADADALVIDCAELIYISSAGLRVILSAHKRLKGALTLKNVSELVMEVLEMTGFTDILVIE